MSDPHGPNHDPAQAAIDALASLDLSDFVYWTVSILKVPFGEKTIDSSAIACGYALLKVEHYLQALRQAEDRRYEIGASVHEDIELANEIRSTDPDSADALIKEALRRTDKTEIEIHFFAVSADQIRRLLAIVTETLGVSLVEADERFLFSYRPLRNQFEHLEERLPGIEKGGSIVLNETSVPSVLLGLRKDNVGRITVRYKGEDVVAEVNEFGYWHVERIVRETFERIHAVCVGLLKQHFTEHPEQAIDPAFYRPMVGSPSRQRLRIPARTEESTPGKRLRRGPCGMGRAFGLDHRGVGRRGGAADAISQMGGPLRYPGGPRDTVRTIAAARALPHLDWGRFRGVARIPGAGFCRGDPARGGQE